jgi:hypothetical protein
MLRNRFMLLIVLLCVVFAASSGCSEKSNGNITKVTVENTNGNASADKGAGNAETHSIESRQETNMKIESTGSSGGKTETKIVSTGNSGDWCPVGSSWSTVNPQTGEMANMKVTGIETVDGIPMCKAVYESNVNDDNYSKLEYLWSQDGKTSLWTAFDASGKKISEVSMKNGTMRMVDKDGKVTEITTQNTLPA